MVRLLPVYTPNGWATSQPQGFPTTSTSTTSSSSVAAIQTELSIGINKLNDIPGSVTTNTKYPLLCRRTREDHSIGVFYGENPLMFSFDVILFEIIVVIFITQTLRIVLRPLKQPRIVSEILGGLVIGPSVLGRSHSLEKYILPENANFVLRNIGLIGFFFFLFISAVKMDLGLMRTSGKKQYSIAIVGGVLTTLVVALVAYLLRHRLGEDLVKPSALITVASTASISSFPVVYPILQEFNLLSSEIGRLALTSSLISDVLGVFILVLFEAVNQGEVEAINTVWYMVSLVVLLVFLLTAVQRGMIWIVKTTPEGEPVDQFYIVIIFLSVFVMAFLTDMFGVAIANGPLLFGLVIPDGPPLGATLVEKSETFVMEVLMPFSYAFIGLYTDIPLVAYSGWAAFWPIMTIIFTGWIAKAIIVTATGCLFDIPMRDSITLSNMLNLRGQVELMMFMHWIDKRIATVHTYTLFVLLSTVITGVVSPCISLLYDPTKPYMVHRRRTIQHTPPDTEMRIVVCVHDQETLPGLVKVLEYSHPTTNSPFVISAIHLIELVGRAAPVFIDHHRQEVPSKYTNSETIHTGLKVFQSNKSDVVKLRTYTAWTAKRTMYQDLCKLALLNKAVLILLPFNKERSEDIASTTELVRGGVQPINLNVLTHAPCSIGILVDKAYVRNPQVGRGQRGSTLYGIVVLFLGGADAREALAYADRMVDNPDVSLTVVRFLSFNNEGDNDMEKKLDDGVVTWFWVKNEDNLRVKYREVTVRNGEETMAAIQAMDDGSYDLWIMGRKQGINPILLEGLSDWSQNQEELGVLGDYIASGDFGGSGSVLVMQQQILRGQGVGMVGSMYSMLHRWFPKYM